MQLAHRVIEVIQSEPIKTIKVGIGSDVVMIELLRSGVYKNPDRVICQEYAANARDAHREVGVSDRPIEITLPTIADSTLTIQDWGPGVSPDRMENVFVLLGKSTKTGDNSQNGGYGIGAKCAWARVDSFNITTVVDKVKYFYIAYVDKTLHGALNLVDQFECDEPNGTTICVPVERSSHAQYRDWIEKVTTHWSPRPIVKPELEYRPIHKEWQGARWWIGDNENDGDESIAIVDGIPYKIELDQMRGLDETDGGIIAKTLLSAKQVFLEFNTGEVKVAASRENLRYDSETTEIIIERSKLVVAELFELLVVKIELAENFKDFCRSLQKIIFEDRGFGKIARFFPKLQWKGVEISLDNLPAIFQGSYSGYRASSGNSSDLQYNGIAIGCIKYYYLNKKNGTTVLSIDPRPYSSNVLKESTLWGVSSSKGSSRPFLKELLKEEKTDAILVFSINKTPEAEAWKKSVYFEHYACIDLDSRKKTAGPQARLPRSSRYDVITFNPSSGYTYEVDCRLADKPIKRENGCYYLLKVNKEIAFDGTTIQNTCLVGRWFKPNLEKVVISTLEIVGNVIVYVVTKDVLDDLLATDPLWQDFAVQLKAKTIEQAAKWTHEQLDFFAGWDCLANSWNDSAEYLRSSEYEKAMATVRGLDKEMQKRAIWKPITFFVEEFKATEREYLRYCLYRRFVPKKGTTIQADSFKNRVTEFKTSIKKLLQHYPLLKTFYDSYHCDIVKMNFEHLSMYIRAVDKLPSLQKVSNDYSI